MENERINSEIMAVDRPWVIRALARMEEAGKPPWVRAGAVVMLREVREVRGTLCPVPEGVTHEELDRRIDAVASDPAVALELEKMRAAGEALVRRAQEDARRRSEAPPPVESRGPTEADPLGGGEGPIPRADEPAPQGKDPGFVDGDALEPNDGGDTRSADLPPTP